MPKQYDLMDPDNPGCISDKTVFSCSGFSTKHLITKCISFNSAVVVTVCHIVLGCITSGTSLALLLSVLSAIGLNHKSIVSL